MRRILAAAVAGALLPGCGGDDSPLDSGLEVVSISMTPVSVVLPAIPATCRLAVVATLADGSERDVTASPGTAYFSTDPRVVGVGAAGSAGPGVVSAAAVGRALVIAEHGGAADTTAVTVDEASGIAIAAFEVSPESVAVSVGQTAVLSGSVAWENGSRLATAGPPFGYEPADPAVAACTPEGVVRGVSPGETGVTVRYGDVSRRVPVAVLPRAPTVSFRRDVLPVLQGSCTFTGCHSGAGTPQRGLRLNSYANIIAGGANGPVVSPGDGSRSRLALALRGTLADTDRMPLGRTPLPEATILAIEAWIDEGALDN